MGVGGYWLGNWLGPERTFCSDGHVLYLDLSSDHCSICIGINSTSCALKTSTCCIYYMLKLIKIGGKKLRLKN